MFWNAAFRTNHGAPPGEGGRRSLFGSLAIVCCCALWFGVEAHAQGAASRDPLPPKVEELLKVLAEPSVQKWLEAQKDRGVAPAAAVPQQAPMQLGTRLADIRRHIVGVLAAVPALPEEVVRARAALAADMSNIGPVRFLLLIAIFVALGIGVQWLYQLLTARFAAGVAALPTETPRERITAIASCLTYDLGRVAAFGAGSLGAFLVFEWPALLREIVVLFLAAIVAARLSNVVLVAMLSPPSRRARREPEALRIVPVAGDSAAFWTSRLTALVAVFTLGFATIVSMRHLGSSPEARYLVAYTFGLGLLAIGIEAVWRAPRARSVEETSVLRSSNMIRWLLTFYFITLWSLWAVHAMRLFWLAVVAVLLAAAFRFVQPCIVRVWRPQTEADAGDAPPSVAVACLERGIRAALIVLAVLVLAWAWEVPLISMTQADTVATRALRGLMSVIIILMIADFIWHVARTAIDLKIAESAKLGEHGSDETHKRARLRTLLPLLRITLLVVLATVAVLTALASLGVEIGPLIAGAGIVGVAVGFGSQTLVRDIMSGVFYLLDDAFRVGDYIISGNHKGTVESFSLRSVRLRHHRGPVSTVPFGTLGAVQNMSRDWVVEKITLGITYDSDVEKARKLIKKIGLELAEDPEFKSCVIEPLKMQGVENFGDFAIELRCKMMTKPQQQYVIKRRALVKIKQAFDENGIKFAYPTVQIAGAASPADAAAAATALPRPQAVE